MTRTVWKYTFRLTSDGLDPVIEIPGGGHFLALRDRVFDETGMAIHPDVMEFDTWWAVNTENVPVEVQLHIRGTGDEVPPSVNYLGTIFPRPGMVMHIWEKDRIFEDMHIVDGKFIPRSQ